MDINLWSGLFRFYLLRVLELNLSQDCSEAVILIALANTTEFQLNLSLILLKHQKCDLFVDFMISRSNMANHITIKVDLKLTIYKLFVFTSCISKG